MKVIGLLGGMSWHSTSEYYKIINEEINRRLGGHTSAELLIYSINLADTKDLQANDEWDDVASILIDKSMKLQQAGAQALVICTNTKHIIADKIQEQLSIPLIHIVHETAKKVQEKNIKKIGLLGTKYTMEKPLYRDIFKQGYGIDMMTPSENDRIKINTMIYDELDFGVIKASSKKEFLRIIDDLLQQGVQGIILGCTEIPLIIKQTDVSVPVFDTTRIHALAAVDFMLK